MIRQDQLLGSGTVDDVCNPIVEIRRAAPCDRDAAQAQASPTFHFCERFPTAFHCCVAPYEFALASCYAAPVGRNRGAVVGRGTIMARQPYERGGFSVQSSFLRWKLRACGAAGAVGRGGVGRFWGGGRRGGREGDILLFRLRRGGRAGAGKPGRHAARGAGPPRAACCRGGGGEPPPRAPPG